MRMPLPRQKDSKSAIVAGLAGRLSCQCVVVEPLTVQVDYPYEFALLGPIVAFLGDGGGDVPGSVTLSPTVVMRNE